MKPSSAEPLCVRLVLADDHALIRSGIKGMLSGIAGVEVVGEARDGMELLALVDHLAPDVVMTDISMPGLDGISAVARIHARHPGIRLLVLSMHGEMEFIRRAVASGASGYLMKDAPAFELEQAVRGVMATGSYFSHAIAQRLLQPPERTVEDDLTQRQIEVLKLVAQGNGSKEIGFLLGLSSKTVDVHRARIMERLGLNDVAKLTMYALRKGLIRM